MNGSAAAPRGFAALKLALRANGDGADAEEEEGDACAALSFCFTSLSSRTLSRWSRPCTFAARSRSSRDRPAASAPAPGAFPLPSCLRRRAAATTAASPVAKGSAGALCP